MLSFLVGIVWFFLISTQVCWKSSSRTRMDAYRIFLAVFICTLGQFVFCNVTKTKYLQVCVAVVTFLKLL